MIFDHKEKENKKQMRTELNHEEVNETFKRYLAAFKSANIYPSTLEELNNHYIITEHYTLMEHGTVTKETIKEITAQSFMCNITWKQFFKARFTNKYCELGNILHRITYKSPYEDKHVKIEFTFTHI